ncbi:PDZ domain-containing protein 2 isoform X2 [Patella vulgata]|nr:PDZ domain-containing protein 2 isoform X2 [Patella vulgata]XP_050399828.1 PDZ domain-containing protein 2 isoform X2 [Patella vulgata]
MELSPGSPANTGFTKYGVRLSPKPFSSLGAQSSPTTAKSFAEGLAVIKEGKFSPVAAPTYRKVSIDKQSETHVEFPFDKNAPDAPSTPATNGTTNGASISNTPGENIDSVKKVNTDILSSSAKNGHEEEIAIKTDLSSADSTPSLSPRSPRLDETDSKPRVSPKTSPRQETTKVHATQIFVGKESKESKLGIDIPKSRAESKIIAATWGKEIDEDTLPQSVKSPPPVAPKPKLRAPKPVPEVPQESAVSTRQKEKSPGAETLKLTDKLKKFETEIQRQTDLAKPAAPPITSRRTSSSSEHSTASIRSTSPDRDVFFQDERKAPEVKSRSYAQDKHSPHMVFTTTVSNKGDLATDQNRAYSMKIANTDNTTEITRTEIRKQSVEENLSAPRRRTSSSTQSPLSPSSPFFQDLSEKPAKINPVKLNRALAPKGSPQNQNVEIKSTVKLTAPSYLPSESKGKKPSQQSWFAGKESSSSMSNVECTSSPSNVVSTKPHLVYQSPGKPSQSLTSPKQSTKSPELVSGTKSDLDNLLSKESPSSSEMKVEYVSPKSKSTDEEKRKSLTDQFDSLLNLDSGNQDGIVAATVVHIEPKTKIVSEPEYSQQVTEKESLIDNNTPVILDDIQVEKVVMVESSPPENQEDASKVQDETNQEAAATEMQQLHSEKAGDKEPGHGDVLENKDVESSLVDYQSAEEGDEVNEDQNLLSESVVEPFAAALVEKVIDSAKDSFLTSLANGEIQSEENGISEEVGNKETIECNHEMEIVDREVEESFSPVSAEVNQSKPDIINDVVDGGQCPSELSNNLQNDHIIVQNNISVPETADSEKSPSPPPLPDAPPPPLPSSPPPPMMSIPPPVSMMGSIEDPPDLVEFMSNDLIPTLKMDDLPKPDLVTDNSFMQEEEEIEIETVTNVSSVPNMIGVISPDKLPDNQSAITVNNEIESSSVIRVDKNEYQKNVNGFDNNETINSNVDTLVATETMSSNTDTLVTTETEGSSVDPLDFVENNYMSNSACAPEHEDLSVVSAYDTMGAADQRVTKNSAINVDITNDSVSTNVNNVQIDGKNDLLDSNENLFSAKPVVVSPVSERQSNMSDISNITNNSTTSSNQVSSFQQSLPSTDQNNEESAKIFSSTPARGQGTQQLVTKNIDIDSSIKSDTSNVSTLLDTSEYVNISITSNGPNITNEAFKVSSSKRDWSFLSNDKDSSVLEGKANTSFEFLDFSNISLIEPEELKRLVDLANQTMDKTGGSIHDQIIVALLHRNQPTDKVGLELKKGSHGKILVSGLSEDGLASVDGKVHVLDCLLSVNGKSVDDRTIQDIQQALETPCLTVVLVLSRGDNSKHLSLNISKDSEPVKTSTIPMTPTTPTTPSYSAANYADYATGEPVEVVMTKGVTGVGFCLEGGIGSPRGDMPIIIKRIFKGGPAEKCGQLQVRDQILQVNDMDFRAMRHYEAWNHLKFLPDGEVKLTIRRNTNLTSTPTE